MVRKIHVLSRKEDIDASKITNCTTVIIDVLLATSTIAATLYHGASGVIPVIDQQEAIQLARTLPEDTFILSGEKEGNTLDGFLSPDPLALLELDLKGKTLIFSSTNGTVAVKKSLPSKVVYTSSLLNGAAVAHRICQHTDNSSVLIICGGSKGRFSMEDILGAGYLISELRKERRDWRLSDASLAALRLYEYRCDSLEQALNESESGHLLRKLGYDQTIRYVARLGYLSVVPRLQDNRLINEIV